MRHLPHLSHLFRLLLGAVLDMAGNFLAAVVKASGSAHARTVENSTAHQRAGGFRGTGTAAGNGLNGTHASGAGPAAGHPAVGTDSAPAPGTSRLDSTLSTTDPTGSTGPVDLPAPPTNHRIRASGATSSSGRSLHGRASAGSTAPSLWPRTRSTGLA